MKTNRIIVLAISLLLIIVFCMYIIPVYNVWSSRKEGEAELAHAQAQREVAVATSKAKYEAATWEAGADTVRAHGIARTNQIIGASLTNPYLHWLWIQEIGKANTIYIPTEGNLPLMEAGRFGVPKTTSFDSLLNR